MMTFEMACQLFINQNHETIGKLRDGHGYAYIPNPAVMQLAIEIDGYGSHSSRCVQYLQLLFGRYYSIEQPLNMMTLLEREALRFGLRLGRLFTGRDVAQHLQLHRNTAQALLRRLAEKQLIIASKNGASRGV